MALREDVKTIRAVLISLGKEITQNGCGSEKLSAYASLTNSYIRLLNTRKTKTRLTEYELENGDPSFFEQLMKA